VNTLLILPVLVPFTTAVICLCLWSRPRAQRFVTTAGMALLLAAASGLLVTTSREGIVATHIGGWPSPIAITLAADLLSATMVMLGAAMGAAVSVYSLGSMDRPRESHGYYPLLNILLMGVCGSFLTCDMFNLFVWFEVMLIASFVLIALGGARSQLEGATKYVTLNLLSSMLFLSALGILYGLAGTLNMADLALRLKAPQNAGMVTTVAVMFLVTFGIKAAMFPFFFWLPASYHTPPVAVSAIFAGLLTKVGVYALLRTFTLIFSVDSAFVRELILVLSGLTMVTGVLGAAGQFDVRRILSFHIVSQIGYMTLGLGLFSRLALAGSIFYIVHHIVVKTNLFLVSGVLERTRGTYDLARLGGAYRESPGLAFLFLIPALSLAGMPPLSGFWAKFLLIKAGLELREYASVAVALLVGLLTLYSMTKIWNEAFWKERDANTGWKRQLADGARNFAQRPAGGRSRIGMASMLAPITALTAVTVAIGLFSAPLFDLALRAADQLLDPTAYVNAVRGVKP